MSGFVDDVEDALKDPVNIVAPGLGATKAGVEEGVKAITPDMPAPPEAPDAAPPTRSDLAAQTAAENERRRAAMAGGRASTILTGGRGLMEPAPVARRVLLG